MPKYAFSFNEEDFTGSFDSREEAVTEAFDYDPDEDIVFTGVMAAPPRRVCADAVIEQVGESATEEAGEWAVDYLSGVTPAQLAELQVELQKVWDTWEGKHGLAPTWFIVKEVKEHQKEVQGEEKVIDS